MVAKTEKEPINIAGHEIVFYPNSHMYKIDGKSIPSVSSILGIIDKSEQLIWWAVGCMRDFLDEMWDREKSYSVEEKALLLEEARKAHNVKKEKAADVGTRIHEWIDKWVLDPKVEIPTDDANVVKGITAFLKWQKENKAEFIANEVVVYHPEYSYVGRLDAVAKIDGKLTIIDFKSSKYIYKEAILQTSAYWEAYSNNTGENIEKGLVIRFGKEDGEFEVRDITEDHENSFKAFIHALELRKIIKTLC